MSIGRSTTPYSIFELRIQSGERWVKTQSLHQPCQEDGDCCSGSCNTGTNLCDNGFNCLVIGATCNTADECCSGTCTGDTCGDCECVPVDGSCTTADDCCGGPCSYFPDAEEYLCGELGGEGGAGGGGCVPAQCKAEGAPCSGNGECCSGLCGGGEFLTCTASNCHSLGAGCVTTAECCSGLTCADCVCVL
jgi:hypothetical protein